MNIIAVSVICLSSAVLAVILRQYKPEYAMLISVVAGCGVLTLIVYSVMPVLDELSSINSRIGTAGEYIKTVIKALGICYIGQFAADACRDAGESSLAGKIELGAKVSIVALSLPLLSELMQVIISLSNL
jgi:stage III sporulation protein AD